MDIVSLACGALVLALVPYFSVLLRYTSEASHHINIAMGLDDLDML